ncbi:hypothetical protein BS47DRAFT_629296 [Hydnum rufescens UP504]|uniref:Uncharacterized protein n=1 Tax=Hydnum rufescens UP504 TaxID=1448309 RepID=A0A9P6AF49_9AGAM|nr:hypothetical protein BS47DRAFT_629296 [Hydnum rufescens UP504]
MPSRRLFSPRRRPVQSLSPPSNDSSPNGPSIAIIQHTPPDLPTASQAVHPITSMRTPALDGMPARRGLHPGGYPCCPSRPYKPADPSFGRRVGDKEAVETMRDGKMDVPISYFES